MDKTIITMLICLMLALYQAPAAGKNEAAKEKLALPTTGQPIKTDKAPAPSLSKPQPTPVKPAPTLYRGNLASNKTWHFVNPQEHRYNQN